MEYTEVKSLYFMVSVPCPIGHYTDEHTKACKECADGTYQPRASQVHVGTQRKGFLKLTDSIHCDLWSI